MASVLLVDDLPAGKRRVLKELRLDAPDLLAAFRNEFALLASLTHPCLTRVHDFGSGWVRGQLVHFYTADQVEGTTLRESARARAEVPLAALLDAVEGLGALHALELCHGDVTPENVLVRPDGSGVLIDLGCARAFGPVGGVISGTPEFMAPELRAGGSVDARSDLFSVGRTLERAYGLARQTPPAEVGRWISKLTAPRAADRPASVEALLQGLGRTPGHGFGA